jgi:hypothetical protein
MERQPYTKAELEKLFGPKRLHAELPGQKIVPDTKEKSFEYGNFETVYPMKFKFVHSFGGFSGRKLQTPPEGRAWIKSAGLHALYWEVGVRDLEGKYEDVVEKPEMEG